MQQPILTQQDRLVLSRPSSTVHQPQPQRLNPILQTAQPPQDPSFNHSSNLVSQSQSYNHHPTAGHRRNGYSYPAQTTHTSRASNHYSLGNPLELMAAAQMQRPSYSQPMYHTPQPASANSVAPQSGHDYRMYSQPPNQLAQPLQYSSYSSMSQVPSYSHHPGQGSASGHGLGSQPILLSHQQSQPSLSHQVGPGSMNTSPRTKLETPLQRSMDLPRSQPPIASPIATSSSVSGGAHTTSGGGGGGGSGAAPGPIPATTPLVVRQDGNGVQWIAFEYSRDRVKMEYTIRCDVESVNVDTLDAGFKNENCVYPRACCTKDFYKGNRFNYETECNTVGWALAHLNVCLRNKRGLIQRAVDSWRNSNSDVKLRSRRVRRQAKQDKRNTRSGHMAPSHMHGMLPGAAGIHGPPPLGMSMQRQPLGMGGPQLHHHHRGHTDGTPHSGAEDASDDSPEVDIRPGHVFHGGYPNYPTQHSISNASMVSNMHDSMDTIGQATSSAAAATGIKREHSEDEETLLELYGDIPETKRRKFVLLVDPERADPLQKKKRVRVQLDRVDLQEVPDSYRKQNAVYPRTYYPQQMVDDRPSQNPRFFANGATDGESSEACVSKTLVPIPLLEGEQLSLPRISNTKRKREDLLNNMCYRMLWSNRSTFAGRTLFMQRSLDLYRQKSRETIIQHAQCAPDGSQIETENIYVPPQFQTRIGKSKWKAYSDRRSRVASEDDE